MISTDAVSLSCSHRQHQRRRCVTRHRLMLSLVCVNTAEVTAALLQIKQTPFVKDIQCVSFFSLVCCRLFGHTGACSACGQSIPASEMVMRAQGNVYHLKVGYVKPCKGPVHPKIKILSFTHPHVSPNPELFSSEEHKRLCLEGFFCPYDRI